MNKYPWGRKLAFCRFVDKRSVTHYDGFWISRLPGPWLKKIHHVWQLTTWIPQLKLPNKYVYAIALGNNESMQIRPEMRREGYVTKGWNQENDTMIFNQLSLASFSGGWSRKNIIVMTGQTFDNNKKRKKCSNFVIVEKNTTQIKKIK